MTRFRRIRPSTVGRGALLALLVSAVWVNGGAAPAGAAPCASAGTAAAAVQGSISVPIVVEGSGGPTTACIQLAPGSTGIDLLFARASALGTPAPRFDPQTGLLCAIDGYPASGCGERTATGYAYWSYWLGDTGSWSYAGVGPGGRRMAEGRMDGWIFVSGSGQASDQPPATPAIAANICVPPPPPTTQPPATQPPATQPPATQPPATQPPATRAPATQAPATQAPAAQDPVTQPATQQPSAQQPSAGQPAGGQDQQGRPAVALGPAVVAAEGQSLGAVEGEGQAPSGPSGAASGPTGPSGTSAAAGSRGSGARGPSGASGRTATRSGHSGPSGVSGSSATSGSSAKVRTGATTTPRTSAEDSRSGDEGSGSVGGPLALLGTMALSGGILAVVRRRQSQTAAEPVDEETT